MRKLLLTRDSVSMGDDVADNSLEIEVNEDWKIGEILNEVLRINYLPQIWGGKATWSVAFNSPLAIIAQQWKRPKIINSDFPYSNTNKYKDFNRLHFTYHTQKDPDIVYESMSRI
ncbi:hypothetical protein [Mucilaginibacter jinjuensis]|uniref:Uncharacterized protein n=1 Tax=Mucilaginibacter jinjuensis TaxID=1176721 RepID=A0ABY7T3C3_9SPHI|nr:hypothetical protein [Mucilaginibacter jinjuensis]WCT10826.1 hypothetical protein PQO05_18995 [Mucilaginibacter jinjuensis]